MRGGGGGGEGGDEPTTEKTETDIKETEHLLAIDSEHLTQCFD